MNSKAAKIVLTVMLLIGVEQLASPHIHHIHASTVILNVGASGQQVSMLQADLQQLGYYTYPTITGYYGSITQTAVARFQADYLLRADGIAGPFTLDAIHHSLVKQQLVRETYSYTGTPYVWGGSSPSTGFDCSGFVYFMFTTFGIPQARTTSANLYTQGIAINKSLLRPGDLVFFKSINTGMINHVGFYIGNGSFISAISSKGIYVQPLDNSYWGPRYAGARRLY
ncbi:C40 family peptidase [Paenibacillus solisilvae]|uniref:C40 family peptidase n=1 Tax=Paenibacillus solisilvae TaxID=2486751 RepID=A0ABW0W3B9_9BACL